AVVHRLSRAFQSVSEFFQFDRHVLDRVVTFFRVLRQTSADNPLQLIRGARRTPTNLRRWPMHNLVERIKRVFSRERPLSYSCFIQNAAEREDVRTVIDLGCPALRLL